MRLPSASARLLQIFYQLNKLLQFPLCLSKGDWTASKKTNRQPKFGIWDFGIWDQGDGDHSFKSYLSIASIAILNCLILNCLWTT